jgi:hypothetical protein
VAVNPALVEFAGTVTVLGTVTAELLLDRFTISPSPCAGAVNVTVHASAPAPVMVPLPQYSALTAAEPVPAVPVPLKVITGKPVVDESLATVSCPVAVPAAAGMNCTFRLYVSPAPTVTGRLLVPTMEKDCPLRLSWAIWTGAEPLFKSETVVLAV